MKKGFGNKRGMILMRNELERLEKAVGLSPWGDFELCVLNWILDDDPSVVARFVPKEDIGGRR